MNTEIQAYPTQEDIERAMARAHTLRSEAIRDSLISVKSALTDLSPGLEFLTRRPA